MTYPPMENQYQRWMYRSGPRGSTLLHRIARIEWGDEAWHGYGLAVTACGREGEYLIPGIFSRMGAKRCVRCCRAVGIPAGVGVPFNDMALTVEERES